MITLSFEITIFVIKILVVASRGSRRLWPILVDDSFVFNFCDDVLVDMHLDNIPILRLFATKVVTNILRVRFWNLVLIIEV